MANSGQSEPPTGPESEETVSKFVESRLTEERLNNLWDRLQGVADRGMKKQRRYSWSEFVGDCWTTLWVTRTVHKIAAGVTVVSAIVIALLAFREHEVLIRTPPTWQSAVGVRLPDILRFRLGKTKAKLEGKPYALAGNLGGMLRGGTGLTSIDVTFTGSTPDEVPVTFRGTLLITNAPGVVDIRGRRDLTGALLTGELTIGTNQPVRIEGQPYLPE